MAKRQLKLSALAQLFANNLKAHAETYKFEMEETPAGQMGTDYDEIEIYDGDIRVRVVVGLGHLDFGDGTTYPSNNYGKVSVYPSFRHIPGGCFSTVSLNGHLDFDYSDTTKKIDVAPALDLFDKVKARFAQISALVKEPIC